MRPRAARMTVSRPGALEVHRHTFVSGPRADRMDATFSHSHEGGSRTHRHPETGPATYTIDQDEWFRETGWRGGGRKAFTAQPTGRQLPWIEPTAQEKTFEVIVAGPPTPELGNGPGIALPMRLMLQFGLTPIVRGDRG